MTLRPHPRLHATDTKLARLRETTDIPFLQEASKEVEKMADEFLRSMELKFDPRVHNSLLVRAREMQTRIVTLLVRWLQTGDPKYRISAMEHVREMARWEHWCWEAMLEPPDPALTLNRLYDLSSGENSATLALAYDWMAHTLTPEERAVFVDLAQTRCFQPFLKVLGDHPAEGRPGWWFKQTYTNWNTVCAGGAGLLALALMEELPELAGKVLDLADESIRPYFEGLAATNGGWVEGIGYWNYGHRYGFMYLLGYGQATGQTHPCMTMPGVRETLAFPLDFTPNGECCSFSDVNAWRPLPFHYEAAIHMNCPEIVQNLDRRLEHCDLKATSWPDAAEWLVFHSRTGNMDHHGSRENVIKFYPGMDWCLIADRMPEPRLYMSIRGGRVKDPHAMIDVLSFNVVIGKEKLIDHLGNRGGDDYLDTTFSWRRNDLFEVTQAAKNVLFINGVGLPADAEVSTTAVQSGSAIGFRIDASEGFGFLGKDSPMVEFCGRLFLMLHAKAFLIVDRFELPRSGRVETRMHTFAGTEQLKDKKGFLLTGRHEKLRVTYAGSVEAVTAMALTCPTKPVQGASVLRWCTVTRTHKQVTLATLLSPGDKPAKLTLAESGSLLQLKVSADDWHSDISLSGHLEKLAVT